MKITSLIVIGLLSMLSPQIHAQQYSRAEKISQLEARKTEIVEFEKNALKTEVAAINARLEEKEISPEQADLLKKEAAEKRARNIEDQLAIVEGQLGLLQRNDIDYLVDEDSIFNGLSVKSESSDDDKKDVVYDKRTFKELVVAFGFNNADIDGVSLNDSPYKLAGSRFFELGLTWQTRVFDESNWLRFKYGFSFQFNGLKMEDNQYFVEQGDQTVLQTFPEPLDKSKFRMDHLVIPVHFELGPSRKREGENYVRYSTSEKFKIGFGGYAGLNLLTIQKLKYEVDGSDRKEKFKQNFNTNNFIYGLSGYVGVGATKLYAKYNLNTIFKDNPIEERMVSLGIRFDFD